MKPSIPSPIPTTSPLLGPGFSRRGFLELGATGLVASWFLPSHKVWADTTSANVVTKNTAKNAIFVFLPGAPSQTDTWDLKETAATPADFQATSYGNLRWPKGLLPKLGDQLGDLAVVRSVQSWALVHGLAQSWSQIARNPTGALGNVSPHLGAVVALEMEARRDPARDVLPSFVALNTGSNIVGAGYLPSRYAPFSVQPSTTGLPALQHPDNATRFAVRWNDLQKMDAALRAGEPIGKPAADMKGFYDQAKVLMDSPDVNAYFSYTTEESARYGTTAFGNSCVVAKKLLAGRRGARFVQVTLGGWDMHDNIYNKATGVQSLYTACPTLDNALSALITDLKATPGETAGKTLFDETIIFVAGEFGRTVGALNGQGGRDHFLRQSVLLGGGGIRGGQVIGSTDATGAQLKESGWSENRDVRAEDLAATLYTALGIDWTTKRMDDPLGRGFEYVPYAADGVYKPVDILF